MFVGSMCAGSMFRKIVKIDVHPNLEIYVYKQQMTWKQIVVACFFIWKMTSWRQDSTLWPSFNQEYTKDETVC